MIDTINLIDFNNPAYINGEYDYWTDLSYKAKSPVSRGIFWSLCGMRKVYNYLDNIQVDYSNLLLGDAYFNNAHYIITAAANDNTCEVLLYSVMLDYGVFDYIYENTFVSNMTKKLDDHMKQVASKNTYREQLYIDRAVKKTYEDSYTMSIMYSLFSYMPHESVFLCIQYFTFTFIFIFFVMPALIYIKNTFDNWTKNEKSIDQDFFLNSLSIESEEEIASIEDMALGLILLTIVFGVFFLTHSAFIISILPEMAFMFYILPLFFMVIYIMPVFLIYDFGIFFLSIFRGASNTASLAMELLYDYIALASAYLRLVVQNVRLLLMIFVYASMHECVMTFVTYASCNPFYESFWDWIDSFWVNFDKNPYLFLLKIPSNIIYWIYELLHTFFVVTVQFSAFFAMVFWIYLFLYTMFFLKKQENFFSEKREKRRQILKNLNFDEFKKNTKSNLKNFFKKK